MVRWGEGWGLRGRRRQLIGARWWWWWSVQQSGGRFDVLCEGTAAPRCFLSWLEGTYTLVVSGDVVSVGVHCDYVIVCRPWRSVLLVLQYIMAVYYGSCVSYTALKPRLTARSEAKGFVKLDKIAYIYTITEYCTGELLNLSQESTKPHTDGECKVTSSTFLLLLFVTRLHFLLAYFLPTADTLPSCLIPFVTV